MKVPWYTRKRHGSAQEGDEKQVGRKVAEEAYIAQRRRATRSMIAITYLSAPLLYLRLPYEVPGASPSSLNVFTVWRGG